MIGGLVEIPGVEDLVEMIGALTFTVDGTGFGFTATDVKAMSLGEALTWLRYQNRRCEELQRARSRARRG